MKKFFSNKRVLLSLGTIALVAVLAVAGTNAFFSDTETSEGNTFVAGAIDLKIDNHSWYYGPDEMWVERADLSWELDDLTGQLFFDYVDLKPGDQGEDTVSIHVNNNDAWVCADLFVTRNDDMSSSEPELKAGDAQENPQDIKDGELAQNVFVAFWADDGDNVWEEGEELLTYGPAYDAIGGLTYAIADSVENNVGGLDGEALVGGETYYIGKYWCYGELTLDPLNEDVGGPDVRGASGFICDGEPVDNMSQTDAMMVDVSFYAVQARHNGDFVCDTHYTPTTRTVLRLENKDSNWTPIINDGVMGELTFIPSHATFDYTLEVKGLNAGTNYTLLYYADPWPSVNGIAIGAPFTADASGYANVSGDVELGTSLPVAGDTNLSAKFWVVPTTHWGGTGTGMILWDHTQYLHEWNLVSYTDL